MTLAWLGFITVALFLAAVLSERVSVLVASILIPAAMAVVAGAAPQLGEMMSAGVMTVAPVGVMMMFAILYFGLMLDLGLVRTAGARPAAVRRRRPRSPVPRQRGVADAGCARRRWRHDLPHFDHGAVCLSTGGWGYVRSCCRASSGSPPA